MATGQSAVSPSSRGDAVDEELDLVADAPGAVGAEVGEVLADLRRVDAGELGQPLRGDGADLLVRGFEQGPVVERKARHRRFRDPPRRPIGAASRAVGHGPPGPLDGARVWGGPGESPYTHFVHIFTSRDDAALGGAAALEVLADPVDVTGIDSGALGELRPLGDGVEDFLDDVFAMGYELPVGERREV